LYRVTTIESHGHWFPHYRENLGRLAAAVERKYPDRGFIDVGANVGDNAAIVRAHSSLPILCIEGSEFRYEILKKNIRSLEAEVELERDRLDSILAKHPRFQASKILKIDRLDGALEWIATARPVLFWQHDISRDAAADGSGTRIFEGLLEVGYRLALLFDHMGDFIQTVSLDARQRLGQYCDICAFHEEDLDLCSDFRQTELENRCIRGKTRVMAQTQGSLEATELQTLRGQTQSDRYRQQLQIMDLETRVSSKDSEIHKLHLMLRDLLVELHVERTTRNRNEDLHRAEREELKGQLTSARGDCASLRHELDTSLALRAARSLQWILRPLRRLIGGSSNGGRT
jgi:hypothetical protein